MSCSELNGSVDLILESDIRWLKLAAATGAANSFDNGFSSIRINICDEHPCPVFRESFRDRATDSVCRAGDDGHFVCESSHHSIVIWLLRKFANGWPGTPTLTRVIV
jgi:hypothetical protein